MKKVEFNKDGILELIEVSVRRNVPKILSCPETEFDDVKVETKVYTDGEVVRVRESEEESIDEFFINGKKYTHQVDKLRRTKVYLKNHSYAVVYTLAEEFLTVGNVSGFFKVIKDTKIYLKDSRDLTAMKKAKKTIEMIREHNNSANYDSLFSMLMTRNVGSRKLEYEKYNKNVYTLRK